MRIESIDTQEDFRDFRDKYDRLYERVQCPILFLHSQWLVLWLKHFGVGEWEILIAWDHDEVVGAMPLVSSGNELGLIGSRLLSDYMDVLVLPERSTEVLGAFLDLLSEKNWHRLVLARIHDGAQRAQEISQVCNKPLDININCVSPKILLADGWENYYSGLSKKFRQNLRTAENKLGRLGELKVFDCAEQVGLDALRAFHRSRQESKTGRSVLVQSEVMDFVREALQHDWVVMSALSLDGEIISVAYCFKWDNRFLYWIPSFSSSYSNYSPGQVHLRYLVEDCFQEGFAEFDFLIGDEPYKLKWANAVINNYEIVIYRSFTVAYVYRSMNFLREALKKVKSRVPILSQLWLKISKWV